MRCAARSYRLGHRRNRRASSLGAAAGEAGMAHDSADRTSWEAAGYRVVSAEHIQGRRYGCNGCYVSVR
jgi:hypothetical protein